MTCLTVLKIPYTTYFQENNWFGRLGPTVVPSEIRDTISGGAATGFTSRYIGSHLTNIVISVLPVRAFIPLWIPWSASVALARRW